MQAMLDGAVKAMRTGAIMQIAPIEAGGLPEGRYGDALGRIAEANPAVSIGSYPVVQGRAVQQPDRRARQGRGGDRGRRAAVEAMLAAMRGDGKPL